MGMTIAAGDKKKFARMLSRLMPVQLGTPCSLLFFPVLLFSLFGFCMTSPGEATASTSFVREISFSSDGSSEKVTIALSHPTTYKANFLDHNPKENIPYRLYFDLSNTTFAKGVNRHLKVQGDCVRVVRSALNTSRTVRVVLELDHKVYGDDYKVIKRNNPAAWKLL